MRKVIIGAILISSLLFGCSNNTEKDLSYHRVFEVTDISDSSIEGVIDEKTTIRVPIKEFEGKDVEIGDTVELIFDYVTDDIKEIKINE